jgi:hypothetical protein
MTLAEMDLFLIYRWGLSLVIGVYTVLVTARVVRRWLAWFTTPGPEGVVGRYAGALLLRTRVRRLGWDFVQIAGLLAVLAGIIYLHRFLPVPI